MNSNINDNKDKDDEGDDLIVFVAMDALLSPTVYNRYLCFVSVRPFAKIIIKRRRINRTLPNSK